MPQKLRIFGLKIGLKKGFTAYAEEKFHVTGPLDKHEIHDINQAAKRYNKGNKLAFAPLEISNRAINMLFKNESSLVQTGHKTLDKLDKQNNQMKYDSLTSAIEAAKEGKIVISLKDFKKFWYDYNIKGETLEPEHYAL